ncbi:protein argonaute-2-like [Homalodisca vitripennis]|uniref:protein argonaute-2-like n=1 Tax=Homalodisca vitripennis TaxID=197043 RepID=UPI001EEC28A7|nr:protein argonaute-2-like [Homalodisca vitripennis]
MIVSPTVTTEGNGKKFTIPERKIVESRFKKRIPIEVNHLLITLKKTKVAIHYDCSFSPEKLSKKLLREIMGKIQAKHYSNRFPAFDGKKNLYSSGERPLFTGDELADTVELPRDGQDGMLAVQVTVKQVAVIDMSEVTRFLTKRMDLPQAALQVLDIVLRNPSAMRPVCVPVGKSFFTPPPRPDMTTPLGNGYELWYGFFQSAVLGWQPYLNVDVAHKGFPEAKPLTEVILEIKGRRIRGDIKPTSELLKQGLTGYEAEDFEKSIKGLRIRYEIPTVSGHRYFKVNGIKKDSCRKHSFTVNGKRITVEEYFRTQKKYTLKYPDLPCIHVGNPSKDICLPPELCTITPGQVVTKKLDKFQTSKMIKEAAKPPSERKQRIMSAMRFANFNQDPCIQEFGVNVESEFTKVSAKVIDSPILVYNKSEIKVENGMWRAEEFISSKTLERWVVVSASPDIHKGDLRRIAEKMISVGSNNGMKISEPLHIDEQQMNRLYENFRFYEQKKVQLAVVVVPERQSDAYNQIKILAELEVGLLTQCIKDVTVKRRLDNATIGNLLLKINAKLNGTNHSFTENCSVAKLCKGVMLLGADVTHPSPDQMNIPSVAAVTASHDRRAFQYSMCWRLQPPNQEVILDLRAIVRKKIRFYTKKNGEPPTRLIFYRDGVSEGFFNKVLNEEVSAIKWACIEELQKELPLTFLVVQKRHHTRFFPTRKADMDRKGNVPPGTVVDTDITHPRETNFYIVSHASLQGTSRPTKYHKLWDDNNISDDDLEELTYYLCHLFSRCTRSVSYPAPTYYAHLAAARGRAYLGRDKINIEHLPEEMMKRTVQDSIDIDSPMFFI